MSSKKHRPVDTWDTDSGDDDDYLLQEDAFESAISAFPKNRGMSKLDSDEEVDEDALLGITGKKSSTYKSSAKTGTSRTSSAKSSSDTSVQKRKRRAESSSSKSLTSVTSQRSERKHFRYTKVMPPSPDRGKTSNSRESNSNSQSSTTVEDSHKSSSRESVSSREPTRSTARDSVSSREPMRSTARDSVSSREPTRSTARDSVSSREPTRSTARDSVSSREPTRSTARDSVSSREPARSSSARESVSSREPPRSSTRESVSSREPQRSSTRESISSRDPPKSSARESLSSRDLPKSSTRESLSSRDPPKSSARESISSRAPTKSLTRESFSKSQSSRESPKLSGRESGGHAARQSSSQRPPSREGTSKRQQSPPRKSSAKDSIPVVQLTTRHSDDEDEDEAPVLDILDLDQDLELFGEDPLQESNRDDSKMHVDSEEEKSEDEEEEKEEEEEEDEEDDVQEATEEDTTLENSRLSKDEDPLESDSESESDDSESGRGRFKSERSKTTTVKTKPRDAIPENLEISKEQQAQIDQFLVPGGKKGRGGWAGRGRGRGGNMSQHGHFPYHPQGQGQGFAPQQQYPGPLYNHQPNYSGQGHMAPHSQMGPGYMNQGQMQHMSQGQGQHFGQVSMHPGILGSVPNQGPTLQNQSNILGAVPTLQNQSSIMGAVPSQSLTPQSPPSQGHPSYGPSKVSEILQGHTPPVPLTSKSSVPSLFTLAGLDKPKQTQQQPRTILINPHFRGPTPPQQDRPPTSMATGMPPPGPQMPTPYPPPTSQPQPLLHAQERPWMPPTQPSGPPYPVHSAPPTSQAMGNYPPASQRFPASVEHKNEDASVVDEKSKEDGPRPQQGFPLSNGPPSLFGGGPQAPRGPQPGPNQAQMGMRPPGAPMHRPQAPFSAPVDNRYGAPPQQRFPLPAGMNQFNNQPRPPQQGPRMGNPPHHSQGNRYQPPMGAQGQPPPSRQPFHPNQGGQQQQRFQPPQHPHHMQNHPRQSGPPHRPRHIMDQQQPRQQQPRQPSPRQPHMQTSPIRQNQFQPRQQFSGGKRTFNQRRQDDSQQIQSIPVISGRQSDKPDHSPTKIAKTEEVTDPVLKAKLEEQRRRRLAIIREKEQRRQAQAGLRRSQVEQKLAQEGKTIADVEKVVAPAQLGPSGMGGHPPGHAVRPNSANRQVNIQGQNFHPRTPNAGPWPPQHQNLRPRIPNTGPPLQGPRHPQQMGGPRGPVQNGPRNRFPGNPGNRPPGPMGGRMANQQGPRQPGPANFNRQNSQGSNMQGRNSGPLQGNRNPTPPQSSQNRQVNSNPQKPSPNVPNQQLVTATGNTNQNASSGKGGNMVLKQKVTILRKDKSGKVIGKIVTLKKISNPDSQTDGQSDRQVTMSATSRRTVVSSGSSQPQRIVVNNQEPRRVVVAETPELSRGVCIDNLSVSTTEANIRKMCSTVGEVEDVQQLKGQKKAIVTFKDSKNAAQFTKKFHRNMVDLSHISVTHLPN